MRAGVLDRRIALQSQGAPGGFDPTAGTWTTDVSVWAEQLDPQSAERYVGRQFVSITTRAYRIRWRTDVVPTQRILDGDTLWQITGVHEGNGRRQELILTVERINDDG